MKIFAISTICATILALIIILSVYSGVSTNNCKVVVEGGGSMFHAYIRFDNESWYEMDEFERSVILNECVVKAEKMGAKKPYEIMATDYNTKQLIFSHNSNEGLVEFREKQAEE